MPFLSEADRDQLEQIFTQQMQERVVLRVLTRAPSKLYVPGQQLCASCGEAEPFARELASLSDRIGFLGLPAGYEFSTLVADIVDVSSGRIALSDETQAELRGLEHDLHLQVFVTPT